LPESPGQQTSGREHKLRAGYDAYSKHFERIVAVTKNFATHSFSLPTSVCARFGKWGGPGIALSSPSERLARIIFLRPKTLVHGRFEID